MCVPYHSTVLGANEYVPMLALMSYLLFHWRSLDLYSRVFVFIVLS